MKVVKKEILCTGNHKGSLDMFHCQVLNRTWNIVVIQIYKEMQMQILTD